MRALLMLIVLVAAAAAVWAMWRSRRAQLREQRRAAWRARRAEEDRIWYETMGDAADGAGGLAAPRSMGAAHLPDDQDAPSGR